MTNEFLNKVARRQRALMSVGLFLGSSDRRKRPMGLLGIFLEPIILVILFIGIRKFVLGSATAKHDLSEIEFLASGIVAFVAFTRTISVGLKKPGTTAKKLKELPGITDIDIIVAGGINELKIGVLLLGALAIGGVFTESLVVYSDIGKAGLVYTLIGCTAIGLSLLLRAICTVIPAVQRIMQIVLKRYLFWTSALFFTVDDLPEKTARVIMLNPLARGVELLRSAISSNYPVDSGSMEYLAWAAVGSLGAGLIGLQVTMKAGEKS